MVRVFQHEEPALEADVERDDAAIHPTAERTELLLCVSPSSNSALS